MSQKSQIKKFIEVLREGEFFWLNGEEDGKPKLFEGIGELYPSFKGRTGSLPAILFWYDKIERERIQYSSSEGWVTRGDGSKGEAYTQWETHYEPVGTEFCSEINKFRLYLDPLLDTWERIEALKSTAVIDEKSLQGIILETSSDRDYSVHLKRWDNFIELCNMHGLIKVIDVGSYLSGRKKWKTLDKHLTEW